MQQHSWHTTVQPRAWQMAALHLWETSYKGVVSVVTGGGKTFLAELCMLSFLQRFPNARFNIVVPTLALLDQWYISLQDDLGVLSDEIACYSGEEKPASPRIINLLVINTARIMALQLASGGDDVCLIVDECHHAGSPINALALRGRYRGALGLSATPKREYDAGFEQIIAPALGEVIYEYSYEQAYEDGVICPFDLVNVRIDLLPNERVDYDRFTRQAAKESALLARGDGSEERLARILQRRAAVSASAAMRIPVAAKLVELNKGARTLVFHERIEAADAIADVLAKRQHNAALYHSKIGPVLRRDNLRLYRHGAFDVMVSCRSLDEGTNVPETSVAVIASSTASHRQRIQRLGRVLRPASGKDAATIYTIYATDEEERRLYEESQRLKEVASVTWYHGSRQKNG